MGDVYRARDTRLNRDVALKVLPDAFTTDPDRLARFKREAHVLASLNHPHIAAIYGFEDTDGVPALILELVDGPTLADRIADGRLPTDEALAIAKQIIEALEAAHEQGIVHRDLKPANIKLRPDGTVKVLDFGLAKAIEPVSGISANVSLSPTITTPAMTRMGVILGTAAYMSPEQAKGRAADKRSDVWAFRCVLYEMLTGTRAFDGEDATEVIAAIVRGEPDWSALPADVPDHIRLLLRRCLEKDRGKRVSDISTHHRASGIVGAAHRVNDFAAAATMETCRAVGCHSNGGERRDWRCGLAEEARCRPARRGAVFAAARAGAELHEHRPPCDGDFAGWPAVRLRGESPVVPPRARVDRGASDRRRHGRYRRGCVTDVLSRRPIARLLFGSRSRVEADRGHRRGRGYALRGRQPVWHLVGRNGDRVWTGR